jgi:hypothetical protein
VQEAIPGSESLRKGVMILDKALEMLTVGPYVAPQLSSSELQVLPIEPTNSCDGCNDCRNCFNCGY